jgi:chemosensory pili system protein ChpA (sensor histidine kinase/response regulator)
MSLKPSYIALDWVKDALDETLQEVQAHLLEQTPHALRLAYDDLHQFNGTLNIAQLEEILGLSGLLEKVLLAVLDGKLKLSHVAKEVNKTLVLLADELSHLQRTKTSRASVIYEQTTVLDKLLLNDTVGQKNTFVPDFSLLDKDFTPSPRTTQHYEKLTQAYQYLLATWLDGNTSTPTLTDFTRVANLLKNSAQTRIESVIWQVAAVFHQVIADGSISVPEKIRPLLIRLERTLRMTDRVESDSSYALIGDLLLLLDPQLISNPEGAKLRQLYGMDLPELGEVSNRLLDSALEYVHSARDSLSIDRDTAAISLREAVRLLEASGWDHLANYAKARLEQLIVEYSPESKFIDQFTEDLNQFADKLRQTIQMTSKSDDPTDEAVIQDARHAAVRESRTALEKIKTALSVYSQSRGDVAALMDVPDLLNMVSGAFSMMRLLRAADLLTATHTALKSTFLKAEYVPHWKQTDLLAQLISSIEYYLDQLAGQYQDDNILAFAEQVLSEFKKPRIEQQPTAAGGEKIYHDQTTIDTVDSVDSMDHVEASTEQDHTAITDALVTETVVSPSESEALSENPYHDDFEQDHEIREIFIEEAEEVLEAIARYYPKWSADLSDQVSLKEIRRAFHTLKGSGRMVGARTVGELAWSIENLLNRIADQSIEPNQSISDLVETVSHAMPILIERYQHKQLNTSEVHQKVACWISNAHDLAKGLLVEPVETMSQKTEIVQQDQSNLAAPKNSIVIESALAERTADQAVAKLPVHLLSKKAPQSLPLDDFSHDQDIRAIFLEEAEDVLPELNDNFPQWAADFENEDALKVTRRNFHTLKGSGRMVGAHTVAELSWSIEHLLNSLLNKSITANQSIVQLVGEVVAMLPSLVEDFAALRAPSMSLLQIVHAAWLLQMGHEISPSQIQVAIQNAHLNYSDIPVLEVDQSDDFDALAEAFIAEASFVESSTAAAESIKAKADAIEKQEASIDEIDPQLLEIFVSESEGYLQQIRSFVQDNLGAVDQPVMTTDVLLRALHTLRGSAGMTGIDSIHKIAKAVEGECKRLMREHAAMTDAHLDLLADFDRLATSQLDVLKLGAMPALDETSHELIERAEAFMPKKAGSTTHESVPTFTGLITELIDLGIDDVLDAEWTLKDRLFVDDDLAYVTELNLQMTKLSDAVTHTSIKPLMLLVEALQKSYAHILSYPLLLSSHRDHVLQDLLSGHAALTRMFDALAASIQVKAEQDVIQRLQHLQQAMPSDDLVPAHQDAFPDASALDNIVPESTEEHVERLEYPVDSENDPELLEIFMEEAEELIQEIDQSFTIWSDNTEFKEPLKALQRQLHTLKGGARMARVKSLGDYTHELETVYERLVGNSEPVPQVLIRYLRHAQDQVAQQVDQLGNSQKSFFTPTETSTLQQYNKSRDVDVLQKYFDLIDRSRAAAPSAQTVATEIIAEIDKTATESALESPLEIPTPIELPQQQESIVAVPAAISTKIVAETWAEGNAPDPEILEIFLDEAAEIIDLTSTQLAQWLKALADDASDPASHKKLLQELQRHLHTFKGGARMAGVDSLGDLSHEMEFVYEDLALGKKEVSIEIERILHQSHDWLADAVAVLGGGERPQMPTALIDALKSFRRDSTSSAIDQQFKAAPTHQAKLTDEATSVNETTLIDETTSTSETTSASETISVQTPKIIEPPRAQELVAQVEPVVTPHDLSGLPPSTGLFPQKDQTEVSAGEMVRISAALMEKMINLAGENAISRARIEMDLTGFAYIVDEMGQTIQKMTEQLRRMDGELESQIIARHMGQVDFTSGGQYQDFDPLEMDQYSSINQLSKSLAESVSDLLDFKNTLVDKSRDSESLLLQQSRIQSELQEGLMSSRLVPFSRLVPRLQRIVRQTATELGKPVELVILNAEGELDRSVLERMVAPLEHMLRNAVDHGIESPANRTLHRKPSKGTITLSVLREGSDVLITLQDDGQGVNVDAVRRKAIERGIIDETTSQTDHDIMQLIFHAGLSTASQVTQISGRGVGMDVVQSEIRQLGGVVTVDSVSGQGTLFTVRLPLTMAVTDALRVRVGDRTFAVSLSQIERIVRIKTSDLETFYQSNNETYHIDGLEYRLRYLAELIGGSHTPILYGQNVPLPLLLIKYEGQRFAVQVDQLIGSREEIVIKPAGLQLVNVGSIAGATISGDGSVVIILDLVALARAASSRSRKAEVSSVELKVSTPTAVRKKMIMVVDDSVTVRKVTTRLLERHGYLVVQAKDGIDAMSKLEDFHPDLMLLDIEMPRMDGFEVATLVRHNPTLSSLPIIMITSRTGEKHRERAYSVGVNGYMGKPFQELILLENISDLLLQSQAEIARNKTLA